MTSHKLKTSLLTSDFWLLLLTSDFWLLLLTSDFFFWRLLLISVLCCLLSESESEFLYDWRFTANQLILAPSPLRLTANFFFFQLNSCGNSPYVTSSLTRRWICLDRIAYYWNSSFCTINNSVQLLVWFEMSLWKQSHIYVSLAAVSSRVLCYDRWSVGQSILE
jgi:hypothetical protein